MSSRVPLGVAAEKFNVSRWVLRNRMREGLLEAQFDGSCNRYLVRLEDVRAALDAWATCQAEGCEKPATGRRSELCTNHRAMRQKRGTTVPAGHRSGADIPNWIGERAGYEAAHDRVKRARGKARLYRCAHCQGAAIDWAYDHQDPDVRFNEKGYPYSLKAEHYMPLCKTCHRQMDLAAKPPKTHCSEGHEFTESNTYIHPNGQLRCRQCRRDKRPSRARKVTA